MTEDGVWDLRRALDRLHAAGELHREPEPVSYDREVAARYAPWAGVPARPPTGEGPALLFENVLPQRRRLVVGVMGSRRRVLGHLGVDGSRAAHARLLAAAERPVEASVGPPTDRVEHGADVGAMPVPVVSGDDAGPFVTMGLVLAQHPDTGVRNVSVHRICVQARDRLTIWIVPGRDLGALASVAWSRGSTLPVSINIGLDPAVYVASCLTGAAAGPGIDELGVAGALREEAVRLSTRAGGAPYLQHAEWVVHGRLAPGPVPESSDPGKGSMPEFLGYGGRAHPGLPVVEVDAVTSREDPVYQTVVGPGLEQSVMLGLGMEVDLLLRLRRTGVDCVLDAHASTAGGGQLLVFLACAPDDDAARRALVEACTALLRSMRMVKILVLVDVDVDLEEHADLWWAVTTRVAPGADVHVVRDAPGFPLDPSQVGEGGGGTDVRTDKLLIDALVPSAGKARFARAVLG